MFAIRKQENIFNFNDLLHLPIVDETYLVSRTLKLFSLSFPVKQNKLECCPWQYLGATLILARKTRSIFRVPRGAQLW
jgi:hypothetical protein